MCYWMKFSAFKNCLLICLEFRNMPTTRRLPTLASCRFFQRKFRAGFDVILSFILHNTFFSGFWALMVYISLAWYYFGFVAFQIYITLYINNYGNRRTNLYCQIRFFRCAPRHVDNFWAGCPAAERARFVLVRRRSSPRFTIFSALHTHYFSLKTEITEIFLYKWKFLADLGFLPKQRKDGTRAMNKNHWKKITVSCCLRL